MPHEHRRPARRRFFVPVVLSLLAFCPSLPAAESDGGRDAMASAMGEAMLRMMETMGFLRSAASAPPGIANWSETFAPGALGQVMPGALGQAMPPALGQALPPALEQALPGAAGGSSWSGQPLEGIWEGGDATLLIVQAGHYRLYAGIGDYLDGEVRIEGDRLVMTNRRESFSQTFEFARDGDRVALRDANGQVYLYRRLRLDGGQTP